MAQRNRIYQALDTQTVLVSTDNLVADNQTSSGDYY